MKKLYRLSVALTAPFLVSGCGMPIGVQIASLLADGLSMITTEKTLTDHGLSALTEKDCIIWRGVKGDSICKDHKPSLSLLANTKSPTTDISMHTPDSGITLWNPTAPKTKQIDIAVSQKPMFYEKDPTVVAYEPIRKTNPSPEAAPIKTGTGALPKTSKQILPDTRIMRSPSAPTINLSELIHVRKPEPSVNQPIERQTYFIIASYHRKAFAFRFLDKNREIRSIILKGMAHGKKVYRVAIGPVTIDGRKSKKQSLINKGFHDTWELSVKSSKVELAALD